MLTAAREDWVLVVGHHPIYADTDKSESERTDMQKNVDAILRRHKNVDMYLCGHIHNFQHIRKPDSSIDYVVNSSGSLSCSTPLSSKNSLHWRMFSASLTTAFLMERNSFCCDRGMRFCSLSW